MRQYNQLYLLRGNLKAFQLYQVYAGIVDYFPLFDAELRNIVSNYNFTAAIASDSAAEWGEDGYSKVYFMVYWLLCGVYHLLCTVYCLLCNVKYVLFTVNCVMCLAYCIL